MNREQFFQAIVEGLEIIGKTLHKKDADWEPVFLYYVTGDDLECLPCGQYMKGEREKNTLAKVVIPTVVERARPVHVALVSAAWTSDGETLPEGMMPSQDPNHKEVMMIQMCGRDYSQLRTCEINRDGPTPKLGEWTTGDEGQSRGRFPDAMYMAMGTLDQVAAN